MNPKKRKPAGRITPHWWCHVVFFSRVTFSFRLARCSESRGSVSVACGRKSPRLLPKMWPQCDWNIYIFPDNWTASVLEQHCWYNENVFRSHLYSYVAAISSSSLPLISSLYVLYDRIYFTWLFCVFLPAAYFFQCFSFCFVDTKSVPRLAHVTDVFSSRSAVLHLSGFVHQQCVFLRGDALTQFITASRMSFCTLYIYLKTRIYETLYYQQPPLWLLCALDLFALSLIKRPVLLEKRNLIKKKWGNSSYFLKNSYIYSLFKRAVFT